MGEQFRLFLLTLHLAAGGGKKQDRGGSVRWMADVKKVDTTIGWMAGARQGWCDSKGEGKSKAEGGCNSRW